MYSLWWILTVAVCYRSVSRKNPKTRLRKFQIVWRREYHPKILTIGYDFGNPNHWLGFFITLVRIWPCGDDFGKKLTTQIYRHKLEIRDDFRQKYFEFDLITTDIAMVRIFGKSSPHQKNDTNGTFVTIFRWNFVPIWITVVRIFQNPNHSG